MIKKNALQKATELLASRELSSEMLRQKLLARKYEAGEVEEAIEKLKKYNYLNDEEICREQFENFYREDKLSLRQIVTRLVQRGFDRDFIEQLIPAGSEERERVVAEKLLAKKFVANKKFDMSKAWQFLSSRGFEPEIITSVLEKFPAFSLKSSDAN